jgi:hypothetical protein
MNEKVSMFKIVSVLLAVTMVLGLVLVMGTTSLAAERYDKYFNFGYSFHSDAYVELDYESEPKWDQSEADGSYSYSIPVPYDTWFPLDVDLEYDIGRNSDGIQYAMGTVEDTIRLAIPGNYYRKTGNGELEEGHSLAAEPAGTPATSILNNFGVVVDGEPFWATMEQEGTPGYFDYPNEPDEPAMNIAQQYPPNYSLFPFNSYYLELDLTSYTPADLDAVDISYFINKFAGGDKVMWNRESNGKPTNNYDEYNEVVSGATVDFSSFTGYDEIILYVGPADQISQNRTRYTLWIHTASQGYEPIDAENLSPYLYDRDENEPFGERDLTKTTSDDDLPLYLLEVAPSLDISTTELYLGLDTYIYDENEIDAVYAGLYDDKDAAVGASATNIKTAVLDEAEYGTGYKALFHEEKPFTLITTSGEVIQFYVQAANDGSSDTYLHIQSIANLVTDSGGNTNPEPLRSFLIGEDDDGYAAYKNWRTLLLPDVNADIVNATLIFDFGWSNSNPTLWLDGKEQDHWTLVDFSEGQLTYTVKAEDGITTEDYFVSVVKAVPGAKLFVHGPETREVVFGGIYGNYHDIFFANIGSSDELTDITVDLIDEENVALDDYWTAGGEGNDTLAPFTAGDELLEEPSEMWNIGKIRLVPAGTGPVTGKLVITAKGADGRVQEEEIILNGISEDESEPPKSSAPYVVGTGTSDSFGSVAPESGIWWVTEPMAKEFAAEAAEDDAFFIRTRRAGPAGVRGNAFDEMEGYSYQHDTIQNRSVQVRLYFDDPLLFDKDTRTDGYVKGEDVDRLKEKFQRWYANKMKFIHLAQPSSFGATVRIAAKVDLSGLDTDSLVFYSYDEAEHVITRLVNPQYSIDANGYLRFTTKYAGEIVITDQLLEAK